MSTSLWTIALSLLLVIMVRPAILQDVYQEYQLCSSIRENIKDLSNHNLTKIPSNLPHDTKYLDVSGNNIPIVIRLDLYKLTNLCFLKMTHCGLQFIAFNAFQDNVHLKVLNISHNPVTIIPYLPLPNLQILDLSGNHYNSYKLPDFFSKLSHLTTFSIGSPKTASLAADDLAPLQNIQLKHFSFGDGSELQDYEIGSFAQLRLLQHISLKVTFCHSFDLFKKMLMDLDQTHTKEITLFKLFPDKCTIFGDPFDVLKKVHNLTKLSFVDTWVNSSVLVKIMQNIWKSSTEQVVFLNIIYNEDTPSGFQFPSQNHTANIRALVFDGVKHYQYRYPTINISMDFISQLTYIKFSATGINIIPCNLISDIPSLQMLDLSNNLLRDNGFWWYPCSYGSAFPALRRLLLSKNSFQDLTYISKRTHEMKLLNYLDLSFNSIRIEEPCDWPTHLTALNLSHNNLGDSVFSYLSSHFQKIDLSKTGINLIPQEILKQFPNLTHLYLSLNRIYTIPSGFQGPTLQVLYIDQNSIVSIRQNQLDGLSGLKTLKAGNNPFVCDCDAFWFVNMMDKTILPDWPLDYSCSSPPSQAGKYLHMYKLEKLSCLPELQVAVALPVVIVIVILIGITFYTCDGIWYAKMLWVWLRVKRRRCKQAAQLMNATFHYHAFISYSQHDSAWVASQLVPSLESAGLSICIHERDFLPGQWIVDNIINCVERSYKTIFVLSNNFVQSDWCNYELFFAQHRAINVKEDSMVLILLEPIPTDSLPKKFLKLRALLRQQTYLEWPREDTKKKVFWSSLRSILHAADKSVILRELALDIADTCPLLDK